MKKPFAVAAALCALLLAACTAVPQKQTVSMFDLSEAMSAAHAGQTEMKLASSSDADPEGIFERFSDMDYGKVESFFLLYAADGAASTDEIAVIALRDAADAAEAAKSLERHVEKRRALYGTYAPELVPALDGAEVFTSAQYAVLIVSPNADAVRRAFEEFTAK